MHAQLPRAMHASPAPDLTSNSVLLCRVCCAVSWSAQSAPGWSPARSKMGCTLHSDGFAYMIAGQSSGGTLNDGATQREKDTSAREQLEQAANSPYACPVLLCS